MGAEGRFYFNMMFDVTFYILIFRFSLTKVNYKDLSIDITLPLNPT